MKMTVSEQMPVAAHTQFRAPLWLFYTYCELLKLLRQPPVVVFGLGFPTLFFAIFGLGVAADYKEAVMASYAAYAAFVVPFSAFSNSISAERGMGWYKLLRTTPLSASLYLAAKTMTILLVGMLSMLILFFFATFVGRVNLPFLTWLQLLGSLTLGMIPFILMGLLLGLLTTSASASVISTLVFFFLSFASGLFIPLLLLPKFVANVAFYLPTYHLGQISWTLVGKGLSDGHPLWQHFLWLAGYGVVFFLLAVWAYNHDENKNFG